MVHLTLFGPPQLACDGRVIPLPVRKTLALVVYLAVEGRTSRARLAELFWGGLDEARARRNLRHALHRLRGSELHELVITDDDTVALDGLSDDLHAFEAAVASGRLADAFERRKGPPGCGSLPRAS